MAEELTLSAHQVALLEAHLPPATAAPAGGSNIWVTLTYAQSLDSSLSLAPGVRTRLSGPESKAMTHYLRSRHDAILRRGAGQAPLVITAASSRIPPAAARVLEAHGGRYLQLPAEEKSAGSAGGRLRFGWPQILAMLAAEEGLASVMVEGGGQIIDSLLDPACHGLVSSVIVTIAPTWLGRGGVVVSPARVHDQSGAPVPAARLRDVAWHPFGDDIVLCGKLEGSQ
ncbi:riboflavin biosynthesis protein Rib7 [Cordyceps militaris CM01]|uniref:2,5-diamino-6-ribosylamino-4(3H)-pyrimidinone 5'-phosphate reductase n=1 Tax=Cordyceps militaris (strain CM01) TaxID=983644 RepID=G3JJ31_CORMM|nr:riboflavin biosynthesis protein Rib7 [Cordyceps militaris CM01]EGX91178.1 riboflavin biosynthesis protein Rib7 [Cordyceps militaris CM01]